MVDGKSKIKGKEYGYESGATENDPAILAEDHEGSKLIRGPGMDPPGDPPLLPIPVSTGDEVGIARREMGGD
jgi:hypothetical protein